MSSFQRLVRQCCLIMTPLVLIASAVIGFGPAPAGASSHREAPLISKDPSVDNTDTYAFVSPDAPNTVTLIANWIPFEEPGGGPNFYHFDDNALYNIKIDRDGDGKPDVTYEWTFRTQFKSGATFLYNTGPITDPGSATYNYTQYYTVTKYLGDNTDLSGVRATNGTVLFGNELMVPDNIGPRSTPDYENLAAKFINAGTSGAANGYKEFTGQREDPFYVDVNSIFDLGGLRPFNDKHAFPQDGKLPVSVGLDSTAGYNVHSTIIQVPISELAPTCPATNGAASTSCVVGVWSTADRPKVTTRGGILGITGEAGSGGYIQVSRLGMPLTNEVVLPLALKDAFNGLKPELDTPLFSGSLAGADVGNLAVKSVLRPELQGLYKVLYPSLFTDANLPQGDRTDLLTIFLTGIPGVNQQANSGNPFTTPGKIASEQLRLNVAIKPTVGVCQGNRLGALAGELTGFPNGRRLEDDVTDIALRAVGGGYGEILGGPSPGGAGLLKLPNLSPGNALGDGVDRNDRPCLTSFPYVGTPHRGYDRIHAAIYSQWLPMTAKERTAGGTR